MAIGKARAENVSLGRYNFVTLDKVLSWASADFLPGEGKIFQGEEGGKSILFAYYYLPMSFHITVIIYYIIDSQ